MYNGQLFSCSPSVTKVSFAVLSVNSITTLFAFFADNCQQFLFSSSRKKSRVVGYLMASGRPILFRMCQTSRREECWNDDGLVYRITVLAFE